MIVLTILAILILIDIIVFCHEEYGWSTFIMIASIAIAYFFAEGFAEAIDFVGWKTIFTKYVPLYLAVGVVTAVMKWFVFVMKHVKKIKASKVAFDKNETRKARNAEKLARELVESGNAPEEKKVTLSEEELQAQKRRAFVEYFQSQLGYSDPARAHVHTGVDFESPTAIIDALTPRAKDCIGTISVWVFQWPLVIIEMLFADFLMKLTKHFARLIDAVFQGISRKLVERATKGL